MTPTYMLKDSWHEPMYTLKKITPTAGIKNDIVNVNINLSQDDGFLLI